MTPRRDDWRSLPMVSCRGLWDKFDGPGTLGSLRRAYRRGVPSLARLDAGPLTLDATLAVWADPSINRRREPIYLVAPSLPDLAACPALTRDAGATVYAVLDAGTRRPNRLYRWSDDAWRIAGTCLAADLKPSDLRPDMLEGGIVLFESANVVTDLARRWPIGIDHDDLMVTAIRACAEAGTTVIRVSDLVEFDQLDARRREAA